VVPTQSTAQKIPWCVQHSSSSGTYDHPRTQGWSNRFFVLNQQTGHRLESIHWISSTKATGDLSKCGAYTSSCHVTNQYKT
jgi:hypothetical protein